MKRLTLAFLAFAVPGAALGQIASIAPPQTALDAAVSGDRISEVVITATPPADKIDVMRSRLSRFVNSNCFAGFATDRFNRAYYTELTGRADYYDSIKGQIPPRPTVRGRRQPSGLSNNLFNRLESSSPAPGSGSPSRGGPDQSLGCAAPGVMSAAAKNTTFARALALYDKGQYDKAVVLFKQAREELGGRALGAEAALYVGRIYLSNRGGVPRDAEQAVVWLAKVMAARDPLPDNPYSYGVRPARYDPKTPHRYYRATAEAAVMLGEVYRAGLGLEARPDKSREWYQVAAAESHVPAVKELGDMYRLGYGGGQTFRKAFLYYDAAGGMAHAGAKYEAAGMYQRGESVRPDAAKAFRLLQEAAVLGDPDAAYALAVIYDRGEGQAVDAPKALGFYKDAALLGHAGAQAAMGTYFYTGETVAKDLPTARGWFEAAAIGGDADGMVNLAAMLTKGEGGAADPVRAWAWLTLARKGGREDVAAGLVSLEGRMSEAERAQAKALVGA